MQPEPRTAIHMEKQLEWAHKLGGVASMEMSKANKTVLARLMESQIRHQLAGSVGRGFRKGTMASASLDAQTPLFLLVYHQCLSSCYPCARA